MLSKRRVNIPFLSGLFVQDIIKDMGKNLTSGESEILDLIYN